MQAHSFLIESSSKLLVTRTGIKARTTSILGLWFPCPICMFFEMRFDLGTLDSGERSLPFWLLVYVFLAHRWAYSIGLCHLYVCLLSTFSNISPLKPLGRLKQNFIWSPLETGEQKFVQTVLVTWPRWPPCPYMVKTLQIVSGTKRQMTLKLGMQHQVREYYHINSGNDPGLTLTYMYLTARSNLIPYAFVWEKGKKKGFLAQLSRWWAYRIGRPPSSSVAFVHTLLNIFSSEAAWPIIVKFHMEPPWDGVTKVYSNGPGHMTKMAAMPIYGKNLKKFYSPEPKGWWSWNMFCSKGCASTTKFVQLMTLSWHRPILRQGQIWSLMLLYKKKVKQWIFQKLLSSMIWN